MKVNDGIAFRGFVLSSAHVILVICFIIAFFDSTYVIIREGESLWQTGDTEQVYFAIC